MKFQNPQFFILNSAKTRKNNNRPLANFNLDINAPMFNPNIGSKSQTSTQEY